MERTHADARADESHVELQGDQDALPAAFAEVAQGEVRGLADLPDSLLTQWLDDPSATYKQRGSLLHWAARHGNVEAVRMLLERGMEVDAGDELGSTACNCRGLNRAFQVHARALRGCAARASHAFSFSFPFAGDGRLLRVRARLHLLR